MILLHRLRATDFKQMESIDIRFPDNGTVLIEGRNEAGKSTLFEAIFFALYGKLPGGADPKEARRYGADKLEVVLDFSIEDRAFCVTRRQGKSQTASLTFPGLSGESERVSTLTAVNQQIVEEMHLSAQGLLNTCFVEQKKLEHLESLDPVKREAAINELVNLSALTKMEKSLTPLPESRKLVDAAKQRLQIAVLDTQYTIQKAEISRLRPLQSAAHLAEIHAAQMKTEQEIETREKQQTKLGQVIALKEMRSWLENELHPKLALWKTATDTLDRADEAVTKAETARATLPGFRENVTRLTLLQDALGFWQNLRDEEDNLAHWETEQAAAQAEVTRLKMISGEAERQLASAKGALLAAEQFDALHEWARASRALETALHPPFDPEMARLIGVVKAAETARDQAEIEMVGAAVTAEDMEKAARVLEERCRAEIAALQEAHDKDISALAPVMVAPPPGGGTGVGIGLATVGAVLGLLALALHIPVLYLPAAFLVVVGATLLAVRAKERENAVTHHRGQEEERRLQAQAEREQKRASLRAESARLQNESDRGQEDARAARDISGQRKQEYSTAQLTVSRAETELATRRAGTDRSGEIPGLRDAVKRAAGQLQTLGVQPLPNTAEEVELRAGVEPLLPMATLRVNANAAQKERDDTLKRLSEADKRVVPYACRHALTEEERDIALSAPKLLEGAGFTLDRAILGAAIRQAERERDTAADVAESLAARQNEQKNATAKARNEAAVFSQCLTRKQPVSALFPKLALMDTDGTPAEAEALAVGLRENLNVREAGEDTLLVSQTLDDLRHENTQLGGEIIALQQKEAELRREEIAPRAVLHLPALGDKPLSELLPDLRTRFPEASAKSTAEWWEQIGTREDAIKVNRVSRRTLAETLQVPETPLDESAEREVWEAETLALDINSQSREILKKTRSVILERILPGTHIMVKRILPLLTENRYREIKWDTKNNIVEVQDDRKGGLAAKKVFSGGTRDQVSLALRLSFVLTTLPSGKATRPGWLFLDEPLSSFDAVRSESLIKLLTAGSLIRPRFPQIFLISHGTAADPARFDYHLIMDGGKISPLSRMPTA